MPDVLDEQQLHEAMAGRPDWEVQGDALVRVVQAADFMGGIRLVDAVAEIAEEMNHHPDIDIRWTNITFRLSTHSAGGITDNDVQLAGRIDRAVHALDEPA